jgi:GTPase
MTDEKEPASETTTAKRRCGIIAVIGAPNAGKSTLVNRLVGAKVTIVSRKVQTTRSSIRGIAIEGESQLIFIDTPGIFEPKRRLDRAMVGAAWTGAADADAVIVLVDAAKGLDQDLERLLDRLKATTSKCYLVLNKVDRIAEKERLLALANDLSNRLPFDRVFMISALNGSGADELKTHLANTVPPGPWLYPDDELTDIPLRLLAAEVTREKIYNNLHDELPYETAVETTSWTDMKNGSVRIEQTIYVTRDSQRSIVLGKGGQTVKRISTQARTELAEILEKPVHLFLFVKVAQGWEGDPERYRDLGLDFPKD